MGKTENKGGYDTYQEYGSVLTDWELWKQMRLKMPHLSFLEEALRELPRGPEFLQVLKETSREGGTWEVVKRRLDWMMSAKGKTISEVKQQLEDGGEQSVESKEENKLVESKEENKSAESKEKSKSVDQKVRLRIFVEGLRIRNYRRYKDVQSGIQFRLAMDGGIPGSLFLIGANGAGKSTQYDALEYLLTGTVQEGGMRSQDFRPRQEQKEESEKIEVSLFCDDSHKVFSTPEQLQQLYPDITHYGIFCSETDILKLGLLKSEDDYSYFFAQLMGYEDLLFCRNFLKLYRKNEYFDIDAYPKKIEEARKQWLDSERDRILLEDKLWGGETNLKGTLFLRRPLAAIRRRGRDLENWCKKEERSLEEMLNCFEEIEKNVNLYNQVQTDGDEADGLNQKYYGLKAAWENWNKVGQSVEDLSLAVEVENKQFVWNMLCQAINDFNLYLADLTEVVDKNLQKYAAARITEEQAQKTYDKLVADETLVKELDNLKKLEEAVDKLIRETVFEEYKEYAEWIERIMKSYHRVEEDYSLKIVYDGKDSNSKLKILLENKEKKQVLPALYYNNFRYKLFCLLLRLVGGLAYMKLNGVRVPIVLDDVFYGSDFNSRTEVKVFWKYLMETIKEQLGEEVQLLVFTHDEIILNAALDAVVEVGFAPVQFGRILDHDCMWNPDTWKEGESENNVFVKFFEYTKKEVRGDA